MLDCINYPLSFPSYTSVKEYEGKGNYAVSKYYQYPWRWLYRHKIRMIERAIRGEYFNSIMDFGSGPGIMTNQWKKQAHEIYSVDKRNIQIPNVHLTICSSVMEFVPLEHTFETLSQHTHEIVVASPMKTSLSDYYFRIIEDHNQRHSHQDILKNMVRYFSINYYRSWCGLYFCARGIRR